MMDILPLSILIVSLVALTCLLFITTIIEQLNKVGIEKQRNYRSMQSDIDIDMHTVYMYENPNVIFREVNNIQAYRRRRDVYDGLT